MQNNNIFYCYSFRLAYFVKSQGIDYLYKGRNRKNHLTFYAFEKSEHLDQIIEVWNKLKSKEEISKNEL